MSVRVYQDWRIHPRYRHLILKPVAYVGHCDQGVVDVPGTRPPSRPGALRRLSERAIVTTLLMPAPLDVDDEIGGVVRRALPIPYVGGSRIQPSSVQSA